MKYLGAVVFVLVALSLMAIGYLIRYRGRLDLVHSWHVDEIPTEKRRDYARSLGSLLLGLGLWLLVFGMISIWLPQAILYSLPGLLLFLILVFRVQRRFGERFKG